MVAINRAIAVAETRGPAAAWSVDRPEKESSHPRNILLRCVAQRVARSRVQRNGHDD